MRDQLKKQADFSLMTIQNYSVELQQRRALAEEAAKLAAKAHQPEIKRLTACIEQEEKALEALMKKNKAVLFKATDRIELTHGSLLRHFEKKVVRVKKMLEKLLDIKKKDNFFDTAVKYNPAVDWDVIEEYSDNRLEQIGTRRQKKETFAFEVKGLNDTKN